MDIKQLEASEVYRVLQDRSRWDPFRHEETDELLWHELNPDFNNAQHLHITAQLGADICLKDGYDTTTTDAVVLTGLVHDAAEAVTGDINFNLKSATDTDDEVTILDQLVASGKLPLTDEELATVKEVMLDSQRAEPETEAGLAFKLSEYVGYLRTGLQSWHDAGDASKIVTAAQRQNLRWLAVDPIANALPVIVKYAVYGSSAMQEFLEREAPTIAEILQWFDGETREQHAAFYLHAGLPL